MSQFKQYVVSLGAVWSFLCTAMLVAGSAHADASYSNNKLVGVFVDEMVAEEGFKKSELKSLFARVEKKQSIINAMSRPAEKTKPWHDYRKIFVTSRRAQQGADFYQKHSSALERAERKFGVPAEVIVAIIGVETRYGRHKGTYRVIDALSTLAFDYPKRSKFFRKELKHFLILARQQKFKPEDLLGSYAGAMGLGQFMPSSYRSYAVDFDGDGKIDIWNNPVDAIGSVANYFRRHGWKTGEPVTGHARVGETYRQDWVNDGKRPQKPKRTLTELAAGEIDSVDNYPMNNVATAMRFEGDKGSEYWVGLYNFYVITRYNHNSMYAMSVYQLAQEIAARVKP